PDENPTWRLIYFVDPYHFAQHGIPSIECFTGLHSDYHQPSDEASLIRFGQLERVLDVLNKLTDFYTQGGGRPIFQRPDWFITPE
ncbi:MAG: M28 family peptidase, partial [Candidatus Zixiibacteriota bacterium]